MNNLFTVVLGLSLLVDLALGAWAGVNFQHFAKTWGLGTVAPEGLGRAAHFLAWVLGTCLVGFAAIQGVAFRWTRRDKDEGPQLAIAFGCWLVFSAVATFVFALSRGFGSEFVSLGWKFLLVDGLRGAALVVLGFLTLNAPSVVRRLRLPDAAHQQRHRDERPDRARHERGSDRPRRSEGGRAGGPEGGREGDRGDRPRRSDVDRPAARDRDRERPRTGRHGERPRRDDESFREGHGRDGREREGRGRDGRRREGSGHRDRTPVPLATESQAVAEARRILPDALERPLTVVVKGAPERIRSLVSDEGRSAEEYPIDQPAAEAIVAEDRDGRRRRRRRRRGGGGSTEASFEDGATAAGYDVLDEPVAVVREAEEPGGADSGEGQEGAYVVRGRSRRRRSPSAPEESSSDGREPLADESEERPGRHHASPVEALDVLRLLEPEEPRFPSSSRAADDRAFGRTSRPASPRRGGAPRHPEDD